MEIRMKSISRQKGAVIITVAMALLFLLGFMGLAMDFGHLFVVKTELQTAADSCALAATQELDNASDSITRATSAGMTVGNLNNVNFQGANAGFLAADITFSSALNGTYSRTEPVATANYVKCEKTRGGMLPWLMQAMSAFSGNAVYRQPQSVFALAVASRVPSQTNCQLPIGVCRKPAGTYQAGEWIEGAANASGSVSGQFRWLDFTGNGGGARELKDVLRGEGQCNLPGDDTLVGKPGNNGSAAAAYNTRFGIYGGGYSSPAEGRPDLTGYAWYLKDPITQPPYPNKYPTFVTKRTTFASYQGDRTPPDTIGLNTIGTIYSGLLRDVGANRRIVPVPIIDCAAFDSLGSTGTINVDSVACVLLLHPIAPGAGPGAKMWLEYRSAAADASNSPCSTFGLAGGSGGTLTPTLVR